MDAMTIKRNRVAGILYLLAAVVNVAYYLGYFKLIFSNITGMETLTVLVCMLSVVRVLALFVFGVILTVGKRSTAVLVSAELAILLALVDMTLSISYYISINDANVVLMIVSAIIYDLLLTAIGFGILLYGMDRRRTISSKGWITVFAAACILFIWDIVQGLGANAVACVLFAARLYLALAIKNYAVKELPPEQEAPPSNSRPAPYTQPAQYTQPYRPY